MNIKAYEKHKTEILKECEEKLTTMEKCKKFLEYILFFGDCSVVLNSYPYATCIEILHKISKILGTKYKLEKYYYNCSCMDIGLIIKYNFDGLIIAFQCNEPEVAIKILGKGKCRTVEETTKHKSIVCDL